MKTINKLGDRRGIKKVYTGSDGMKYRKFSRWIQIKNIPVTETHFLWDYAYGGMLECFRHGNSIYPTGQIEVMSGDFITIENADPDGYMAVLSGYICFCNWGGVFTEIDSEGEHIRLWECVTE